MSRSDFVFRFSRFGFRDSGFRCRFLVLGFRIAGSGFSRSGSQFPGSGLKWLQRLEVLLEEAVDEAVVRVPDAPTFGSRDLNFGFRVSGFESPVLGSGFEV